MKNAYHIPVPALFMMVFFIGQAFAEPLELNWDDLRPEEGKGIMLSVPQGRNVIGALKREEFSDFTTQEFEDVVNMLEEQRLYQPSGGSIRTDLDGKNIRIAGYITPVEIDGEHVTGFLLVPYLGACIHVPSPPGNQIIYVSDVDGLTIDETYNPVWVIGTLQAKPLATVLANVGYRIEGADVSPYK
jgi:hypothetical protein